MRVLRGRASIPQRDRAVTADFLDAVSEAGDSLVRVWRPPAHVAFGRRDTNREGYQRARAVADERGLPTVERGVGGHAVYYTGNTAAVLRATPTGEMRSGIDDRYERTTRDLQDALSELGVTAYEGEPEGAFCPGTHSLSATGKIIGLAQRVRKDVAVVAGIVVVRDHEEIASVLAPLYDALDIAFERDSVGSIARAGGEQSWNRVRDAFESALAGPEYAVERVRET